MKHINRNRIIAFALLFFWMSLIFYMSAQPAHESSQISGGIVSKLIAAFFSKFDSLSLTQQENLTQTLTIIVRKTAHFLEYFILSIFAVFAVQTYKKYKLKSKMIFAFLFCVFYAVSDEVHQYFVPGRACRLMDICIDTAGSAVAICLMILIFHKKKYRSGESYEKKEVN